MRIFVKYDYGKICSILLREQLDILEIAYTVIGLGEVHLDEKISAEKHNTLAVSLQRYGIEILNNKETAIIDRIKNAIDEMLAGENTQVVKFSAYLADKLNYSYAHLSNIFTETTFSSIENYIILRKIDFAKDLLCEADLTLTEIAYKLNYSSVAHLSTQFKKTTGLTPSTFQRIIKQRKSRDFEAQDY